MELCESCKKLPKRVQWKGIQNIVDNKKILLLFYDLYDLRYKKPGEKWHELTDYLRDNLHRDGFNVSYDDKNEDLIFNDDPFKLSMKKISEGGTFKDALI